MRLEELLKSGVSSLETVSSTPRLDAEVLLADALGVDRSELHRQLDREAASDEVDRYRVFIQRRKTHEPVAYIIGVKEFWSLDFVVNSAVLIPRPESELLVEKGLEHLKNREGEQQILDLGTGSGCLAVAIAHELQKNDRAFSVLALDSSSDALEVAAENAVRHGVGGDVLFLESTWFSQLDPARENFDLIIANPPYIASGDRSISPELRFEPAEALFAGRRGTEAVFHLMQHVSAFLKPDGVFLCEIGMTQRSELLEHYERIRSIARPPLGAISFHQDLAGLDRVVEIRLA